MNNEQRLRNLKPNYDLTGVYSINDIKRLSKGHFFDKSSMRFFNSRICGDVIPMKDQVLFITSEKFDYKSPRRYTIRNLNLASRAIDSVSGVGEFSSKQNALTCALKLATGEL
jgi:hypothetical protein